MSLQEEPLHAVVDRAYKDFYTSVERGTQSGPRGERLTVWAPPVVSGGLYACLSRYIYDDPSRGESVKRLLLRRFVEYLLGQPLGNRTLGEACDGLRWETVRRRPLSCRAIRSLAEGTDSCSEYSDQISDMKRFKKACRAFIEANHKSDNVFRLIPMLYMASDVFGIDIYLYDLRSKWDPVTGQSVFFVGPRPRCYPIEGRGLRSESLTPLGPGLCLLRVQSGCGDRQKDRYHALLRSEKRTPLKVLDRPQNAQFRLFWYAVEDPHVVCMEDAVKRRKRTGQPDNARPRRFLRLSPGTTQEFVPVQWRVHVIRVPPGLPDDTVFSIYQFPGSTVDRRNLELYIFCVFNDETHDMRRAGFVSKGNATRCNVAFRITSYLSVPIMREQFDALACTVAESMAHAEQNMIIELSVKQFITKAHQVDGNGH